MSADGRTVVGPEVSAGASERRAPRREVSLEPGDVLNGIYRVDRFIARGGMGEVFEGVNVESDERVAIKAMRSHLAADPKVLAMFRKEAQVLTRIAHPAIVQYRVLARDPELDLYYIVTDFINGEPLSAHLDGRRPSIAEVVRFARRLASGLEAAHEYGAIHRDMSPDNILLPDGLLERAKIIDFGIAKSLDVTAETVVGDGFAGKLGYVAPEQFGDFDRQVGPWTDVYSTALVLLAFVRGRAPDMGKTLSEAIERRREGPDLSGLPAAIEPLLRRMLIPDPRERIRSMADVLVELGGIDLSEDEPARIEAEAIPPAIKVPTPEVEAPLTTFLPVDPIPQSGAQPKPAAIPPQPRPASRTSAKPARRWVGGAVALPMATIGAVLLFHHASPAPEPSPVSAPLPAVMAQPAPQPVAKVGDVGALLRAMPCTWLHADSGAPALQLSGGARDPVTLDDQVMAAARANGLDVQSVNSAGVVQVPEMRCDLIEALRPVEPAGDDEAFKLVSATRLLTLRAGAPGCPTDPAARTDLTVVERDPKRDFALFSILPGGVVHLLVSGRRQFAELAGRQPQKFQDLGDGRFQVSACYGAAGPVGIVLVDRERPLDLGLPDGFTGQPPAGFASRVRDMAEKQGWRARSTWLRIDPAAPGALVRPAMAPAVADKPAAPATPALAPLIAPPPVGAADEALRPAFKQHAEATSNGDFAACRRWDGKRWSELGYASRAVCVERVFKNRCGISSGQFGDNPLRRYNGRIEWMRGNRWSAIAKADPC
ncbi:serine/threonine-protein kinase [Sphingomonas sp. PR090111-T3T-6A]|uniref:serine/threonine-protein kinase n=1 Tax=Sphingomonas sp. PR090111-T3T-6A TaxID=685778 RepID=UPI0003639074|nr:serine/threonine-protein kinase [Sphingomonas sp. PR090111-T3T-6A]